MELTELNEHFSRVLAALKEDHAASTIDLWFKDSFVADFDGRTVTVALENDFKKNTVSNRYRDQLKQKLCEELNGDFNVTLITKDDMKELPIMTKHEAANCLLDAILEKRG